MTGYQTAKYVVRLAEPELVVEAEVEAPDLPVQRRPTVLQAPLRPGAGFLQDYLSQECGLQATEEIIVIYPGFVWIMIMISLFFL